MTSPYHTALSELAQVFDRLDDSAVDHLVSRIINARSTVVFGAGRERLQIMGLAMRLHHLGLPVAVVGDMTAPPVGPGDLFLLTVGPGTLSTALALIGVARSSGAEVLVITAQPQGAAAQLADAIVFVPAQTMANDTTTTQPSGLPMGSLYEGALFILFEVIVQKLQARLCIDDAAMRANHTNLE